MGTQSTWGQESLIMNLLIVAVLMFFTVSTVKATDRGCCTGPGAPAKCAADGQNICIYVKNGGSVTVTCGARGTATPSTNLDPTKCYLEPSAATEKLTCKALPMPCQLTKAPTAVTNNNNNNNNNNNSNNSNNPNKGVSSATSVIFAISLEILI